MAIGANTFSFAGGAVDSLFKGLGSEAEAKNYRLAAKYADQNAQFTEMSTAVKQTQATRAITLGIGETKADVAGAGFAESGSALDLLRDSASQGALQKAVLSEQGLITEEGYKVQAQSYRTMAEYADMAATGDYIAAGVKGVAAIATLAIP